MGVIYRATNLESGKIYIGKTKEGLEHRRKGHEKEALNPKTPMSKKSPFHKALLSCGLDQFSWDVLHEVRDNSELNNLEKFYIKELKATEREIGYNLMKGGDGGSPAQETRDKISATLKGKPRTTPIWNKGLTLNDDYKRKISEASQKQSDLWRADPQNEGKALPKEACEKISIALKGRPFSAEHIQHLSESHKGKPGNKGFKHSEEVRKRMSESAKKRPPRSRESIEKGIETSRRNRESKNKPR